MSVPRYLLGRHLTAVTLTPQTVAADGTLSNGTPVTLTAVVDSLQDDLNANTEEISAVNSTRQNNVVLDDGASLQLAVIRVNNGTDPAPLRTAFGLTDVFKVAYTEGTGSSAKVITGYYTRSSVSGGFQGKGKQIGTFAFIPVDAGSNTYTVANPT
jgi:hypothetical protein